MTKRNSLLSRAKSFFGFGAEGSWRGPFFGQGHLGNWFELGRLEDGFQRDLSLTSRHSVAAKEAAINCYANAFMLMPVWHKRGPERVTTSAAHRWLNKPNSWQTPAEFFAMGIRALMEEGNAVAAISRNDRFEIVSMVWASSWSAHRDPETGDLFYGVNLTDETGDPQYMVPARDIMHWRINADTRRPLLGRSPIQFCAASLATNATLSAFLVSYLNNRASPSYALATDERLTADQMKQLRAAWNEQARDLASGGTPILQSGLKPLQLGVAPGDSLLVDTFRLSVEDVARAFGIPRSLLGVDETASNAENLMRSWLSLGLGGIVEMVEQSLERAFGLDRLDGVEFDSSALLRMDPQSQAEMVARAVTGGVLSPDEGREIMGYTPVTGGFGAVPAAQQQMVPLNLLAELHAADLAAKLREPEPPAPVEQPEQPAPSADPEVSKALVVSMLEYKRKAAA